MGNIVSILKDNKQLETIKIQSPVLNYISSIERVNEFEYQGVKITFSDDVWDFSALNKTAKGKSNYVLKFNAKEKYTTDLKKFATVYLATRGKVASARKRVGMVRRLFLWMESKSVLSLESLTREDLEAFFKTKNFNPNTTIAYKESLYQYFTYYSLVHNCHSLDHLKEFCFVTAAHSYAARENYKTPNISPEIFNKLLSAFVTTMNNENETVAFRATAAMMVILSQTGLRISELLSLKEDCLDYLYSEETHKKLYFLKYETTKRIRKIEKSVEERTLVNDHTFVAVSVLKKILAEYRSRHQTNYLYAFPSSKAEYYGYPIIQGNFTFHYMALGVHLNAVLGLVNNPKYESFTKYKLSENDYISLPTFHQYRVKFCSDLYAKGVSLDFIEIFMNHLSNTMRGYHIELQKTVQENTDFSKKILYDIVKDNITIIGGDNGLQDKINMFIEQNEFHILNDIDEIVELLSQKIPIRQKTGGVCIKSSIRPCSMDAKTNEFYCAYGVCPNIVHFYYMIDIAYEQCMELSETILHNEQRGCIKQASKEKNMFRNIFFRKLIPEYDELKKVLNKQGVEQIILEHPQLYYIVSDLDAVERKIEEWKKYLSE